MTAVGRRHDLKGDRGTAAVELALILPLLLVLLLGTIGFGRAYHTKLELSNATQEGVRTLVFRSGATTTDAVNATIAAATLSPALTASEVTAAAACSPGVTVSVEARRQVTFDYYLGTFNRVITGTGVMRCAG